MPKILEPAVTRDAVEWKRIIKERPVLGSFRERDLQGWALKLSTSVMSPWDKRWFVFCGNFVCYFPSADPGAKCSGCYYMPGMVVERLACIPNHPSAPVHFNAYKENCVLFRPMVPRKPGGDHKDLILSLPGEEKLQEWTEHVKSVSQGKLPPATSTSTSTAATIIPSTPTKQQHQQRSGTGPTFSSPAPTPIPPQYQAILKYSGISAEEAAFHPDTVLKVLSFSEKHPAGRVQPQLLPCANIPKKQKYELKELLSQGDVRAEYSSMVKLDSGSQGEVYKATRKKDGEKVALKMIYIKNEAKELPALENEISMMFTSQHKNIVSFFNAYRKADVLYIAMELMSGGKLTDLLDNHVAFSEDQIAYICKNVMEGLAYLHSMGRIHRDIKSDNVLLNTKGDVKMGDFGFCAALAEGENLKRKTVVGTPYWMAPEVIRGEPYDYKADIWSMGILALELCDGEPPWMEHPPMRALYVIVTQPAPKVCGF